MTVLPPQNTHITKTTWSYICKTMLSDFVPLIVCWAHIFGNPY